MATYKTSKEAWRTWYKHSEFQSQLQTETLQPGANTRDITVMGQGKYVSAIVLKFTETVADAGKTVLVGTTDLMDEMLSNFRIKSQGKLTEQLATSGHILTHLHHAYLDQLVPIISCTAGAIPGGGGEASATLVLEVVVPVAMEAPFNITMLANLNLAAWTPSGPGALTLTSATCQINVVTTDTAPPLVFAFASQTATLPTTGSYNVTTLTMGFLRESISLLNYPTKTMVTTLQYVLDDGRGIIYADARDTAIEGALKYETPYEIGYIMSGPAGLAAFYASPVVWQSDALANEQVLELSYLSGGVPMPWHGAGRFVINTVGLSPATVDLCEILIAAPVSQQLSVSDKNQPTTQRPRTDLSAGGQTVSGSKPKVRY